MATVAIIHAADDALPARALAEKLRAAKLTVVLEKTSGEELRNALKGANVSIALWSPRSVGQTALADDAGFAKSKTKLIHATMQNASPPDAFKNDKVVNLTGWRGEDEFPAWRELAKQVTEKAGVAPLPPPAPRPASGFFQPGAASGPTIPHPSQLDHARNAPHQRAAAVPPSGATRAAPQAASRPAPQQAAPRPAPPQAAPRPAPAPRSAPPPIEREERASGGGGKGMMIGIVTFIVVAVVGAGGYYFWSQGQGAQATSAAWEQVDHNDASAIRAFLAGDPGESREEAQQALAQLEERSFEAASDADTIQAFESFLNDFPDSQQALAARGRIAELQTMTPTTGDSTTEAVPVEGVTNPDLVPPGAATPAPTTPAPTTGGPATLTPPATEAPPATEDPPTN